MSRPATLTLSLSLTLTLIALVLPVPASAAVTVTSFTAGWQGNQVVVNWRTATELNNRGFNIFRSTSPSGSFQKINSAEISAHGDPFAGASYSYVDPAVTPGQTYYYKLQSVENNGTTIFYEGIASTASSQTQATATHTPTRTATKPPATATATLTAQPPATATATLTQPTATRTLTVAASPTPVIATPSRTATASSVTSSSGVATPTPPPKVAFVPTSAPAQATPASNQVSVVEPTPEPTQVAVAIKESPPEEATAPETVESDSDTPDQSTVRAQQLIRASIVLIAVFAALIGGLFLLGAAYFFARNYSR